MKSVIMHRTRKSRLFLFVHEELYSTKLAEKGAWLLYSNESSSETIQEHDHVRMHLFYSYTLVNR